jgi:cytochrome c-type biogenesis protein CcmH
MEKPWTRCPPTTRDRRLPRGLVLAAVIALASVTPAVGQPPPAEVDRAARAIYGDFMSPWCPGLLLSDCRSSAAVELRDEVRRDLQAGAGEAEVRARIEARVGEKLLAAPHARGFGLVAWITPFAMVALGLLATLGWMRSHRTTPAQRVPDRAADPAMRARLEEEKRRFAS